MFRTFVLALVLLALLALAPLLSSNNGLVVIYFGDYQVQFNLLVFALCIVLLIASFYILEGLVRLFYTIFIKWWVTRKERRARKSANVAEKGLRKLVEGDYKTAQKLLTKSIRNASDPVFNLTQAIDVAIRNGKLEQAEIYLADATRLAKEEADVNLVDVVRLKLLVAQKAWDNAFKLVSDLKPRVDNSLEVSLLAVEIYRHTRAYAHLEDLNQELIKSKLIPQEMSERNQAYYERGFIQDRLDTVDNDFEQFLVWWKAQPSRRTKSIIARNQLVLELKDRKMHEQAVQVASETLKICNPVDIERSNYLELIDDFHADNQNMELVSAVSRNVTKFTEDYQIGLMQVLTRIYFHKGDLDKAQTWAEKVIALEDKAKRQHAADNLLLVQMLYRKKHNVEKLLEINGLIEGQYSLPETTTSAQEKQADKQDDGKVTTQSDNKTGNLTDKKNI